MLIFGIGKGVLTNLLFTSQKSLKKHTVVSFLGIMKDGKDHSDAGCLSKVLDQLESLIRLYFEQLFEHDPKHSRETS
jgi:hypothetical protein